MADLVIVGFNKVSYIGTVEIVPAEGAYISIDSYEMSNPANNGETFDMDLVIKNVGVETANNIDVTLSTENEYLTILSANGSVAMVEAGATATIEGFQFEVADNAPDGMPLELSEYHLNHTFADMSTFFINGVIGTDMKAGNIHTEGSCNRCSDTTYVLRKMDNNIYRLYGDKAESVAKIPFLADAPDRLKKGIDYMDEEQSRDYSPTRSRPQQQKMSL